MPALYENIHSLMHIHEQVLCVCASTICADARVHTQARMHTRTHTYVHTRTHARTHARTRARTHAHVLTHTHISIEIKELLFVCFSFGLFYLLVCLFCFVFDGVLYGEAGNFPIKSEWMNTLLILWLKLMNNNNIISAFSNTMNISVYTLHTDFFSAVEFLNNTWWLLQTQKPFIQN